MTYLVWQGAPPPPIASSIQAQRLLEIFRILYIYFLFLISINFQIITDVKDAWEGIQTAVKSTPTMVFSVIGDSDSFVPRPWPRTVFQTALIEAAKSGGGMLRQNL